MTCVLGIDIGTTSTIGILIRLPDRVLALASRPVTLMSPHPGWAEEDPDAWWANLCAITRELVATSGIAAGELAAIGIAGMLPAVVLLDAAGRLLRPSIQQSDGRCAEQVAALRAETDEASFLKKAGNGINQQLVAAKLRWVEEHEPNLFRRIATVFGSYDYINWRLTGERAVEQNWALEAGFVDLVREEIDDELVALAHVPRAAIPRRTLSHAFLGRVSAEAAALTGLPAGLPVAGGAADFIASALAAGVVDRGQVLLKFGGSVDVLGVTDRARPDPRLYLDHHLVPGLFAPNGCMATGGSGLNWMAATMAGGERAAAEAAGLTLHQHLDRLAATVPAGADGLTILPYFLGEKTPIHEPEARGVVAGLSFNHDIGHLWRALLESYAYAIAHHLEVMREIGHPTTSLLVSDGGAQSDIWMQIVADVTQDRLHRLQGHPGSCLGAAWTAAMAVGAATEWHGVAAFVRRGDTIQPDPARAAPYARGYAVYRELHRRGAASPLSRHRGA